MFFRAPGVIQWGICQRNIREPLALTSDSAKPELPAMWREMGRDRNLISNPPAGWGATRGLHSDRARSDNLCNRLCGLELCPSATVRMWTGFLSTLLLWWLGRRQAAAETIVDPGFCAEGIGYKVRTCKVSFPGLSSTCCASAEFSLALVAAAALLHLQGPGNRSFCSGGQCGWCHLGQLHCGEDL